ncbi:MAG: radical SAM protein, partial [Pseudomonadota bacterium]
LEDLLEELLLLSGLRWIRILYSHPQGVSDRLLDLMEGEETICPYLDLPFQHTHETILKRMRRFRKGENPWRLIERIRSRSRPISLRTTLMVGFPGETRAAFNDLYHFVKTVEFDHLGVFLFSPEKGTAASRFKDVVEKDVAEERLDAIMRLQAGVSKKKNKKMVGHVVPVLVEGPSQETEFLLTGRTDTMAPDVDGQVLINRGNGVVGEILPVRITGAHTYDLVGEIMEKREG